MKTIKLIIIALFITIGFTSAQQKIYVYKAGAILYENVITGIDSISFTTPTTVADADGNVYHLVTIGTQVWTIENLKTTKYRNSETIANVTDGATWAGLPTGAWCNNELSVPEMGYLYNYYAIEDSRNLAPAGFHVATSTDWDALITFIGGTGNGGKLKETGTSHWLSPNTAATNDFGFSALGTGYRTSGGGYGGFAIDGGYAQTPQNSATNQNVKFFSKENGSINTYTFGKTMGVSVRLVKD